MKFYLGIIFIISTVCFFADADSSMTTFINKHMVPVASETATILKISEDCKAETNVQEEDFAQLLAGAFPENRELKCFFKCFALKYGSANEKGEMILEKLETSVRKKQYDVVSECVENQELDLCEKMYAIHKCYANKLKEQNVIL